MLTIFGRVSQKLEELFTPFYGYVFELLIRDLKNLIQQYQSIAQGSSKKRDKPRAPIQTRLDCLYIESALSALNCLFRHDIHRDFVDSIKFDQLAEVLSELFTVTAIGAEVYTRLAEDYLWECIISLCLSVGNDYQVKALNYKVLATLLRFCCC